MELCPTIASTATGFVQMYPNKPIRVLAAVGSTLLETIGSKYEPCYLRLRVSAQTRPMIRVTASSIATRFGLSRAGR